MKGPGKIESYIRRQVDTKVREYRIKLKRRKERRKRKPIETRKMIEINKKGRVQQQKERKKDK